jgi:hypothetical protein
MRRNTFPRSLFYVVLPSLSFLRPLHAHSLISSSHLRTVDHVAEGPIVFTASVPLSLAIVLIPWSREKMIGRAGAIPSVRQARRQTVSLACRCNPNQNTAHARHKCSPSSHRSKDLLSIKRCVPNRVGEGREEPARAWKKQPKIRPRKNASCNPPSRPCLD